MIKYDRKKLVKILLNEYHEKYGNGGHPSATMEKLLDCMDDAFIDEYSRQISNIEGVIQQEAIEIQEEANDTLQKLYSAIEQEQDIETKAREATVIHDERVADALKAYRMIIDLEFDTPQQKLQNIQNASYFIWALYAKESATASMFMKSITDVKNEDEHGDDGFKPMKDSRDSLFDGVEIR